MILTIKSKPRPRVAPRHHAVEIKNVIVTARSPKAIAAARRHAHLTGNNETAAPMIDVKELLRRSVEGGQS